MPRSCIGTVAMQSKPHKQSQLNVATFGASCSRSLGQCIILRISVHKALLDFEGLAVRVSVTVTNEELKDAGP